MLRAYVLASNSKAAHSVQLTLERGDLTKWAPRLVTANSAAIANAANERMLGGGGVDGAIHRAAGQALLEACRNVPETRPGIRCPTGEARITSAGNLGVANVIHTVGPIYDAANPSESKALLTRAYANSLAVAADNQISAVAFPAISCGVFGYPIPDAAHVAVEQAVMHATSETTTLKEIAFVLFDNTCYDAWVDAVRTQNLESVEIA